MRLYTFDKQLDNSGYDKGGAACHREVVHTWWYLQCTNVKGISSSIQMKRKELDRETLEQIS